MLDLWFSLLIANALNGGHPSAQAYVYVYMCVCVCGDHVSMKQLPVART